MFVNVCLCNMYNNTKQNEDFIIKLPVCPLMPLEGEYLNTNDQKQLAFLLTHYIFMIIIILVAHVSLCITGL